MGWYATSVFYDPRHWPYRVERFVPERARDKLNREFRRRWTPLLDPSLVRTFGFDEWVETITRRMGFRDFAERANVRGNRRFAEGVIELIKREPVEAVWGYNSASVGVFRWAKRQGLRCILDQSVGHPRAMNTVMLQERERNPEFFPRSYLPYDEMWIERQDEEVALADVVLVGSEFCARTMIENGCPREKIRIVPYGFDETLFPDVMPIRQRQAGQPARFLFVGALDSRKGIAYLLQAFARIPPSVARLTLAGYRTIPDATFRRYADFVTYVPQTLRSEIPRYFAESDCFIFPSLFEGSALVLYEAVGSGLGMIQSAASGTGATQGENGVILENVSVEAVADAVADALSRPEQLAEWQRASWQMRPSRGWSVYRERLRHILS